MIEKEGYISYVYTEYKMGDDEYQEFFRIAMTNEVYDEVSKDETMTGILLAEKDGMVYVLYTPLDMAIMDSQKAEEYQQLYLSQEQVRQRFKLVKNRHVPDEIDIKPTTLK